MNKILVLINSQQDVEAITPTMNNLDAVWGNDIPFENLAYKLLKGNSEGIVIRILETDCFSWKPEESHKHTLDHFGVKDVANHEWLKELYDKAISVDEFILLAKDSIKNIQPCDPTLMIQL